MLLLKVGLILLLFFSDGLILNAFKNYTTSGGDPKQAEETKKQLQWGIGVNLLSAFSLIGIHVFEGVDFSAYTAFEWGLLAAFGGFMLIVLIMALLFSLRKKKTELFEVLCIGVGTGSFVLGVLCFHLFLNLIQF